MPILVWVARWRRGTALPEESVPAPLLVINKVDLPPAWDFDRVPGAVRVSARTGAGIDELCRHIVDRLVPQSPAARAASPSRRLLREYERADGSSPTETSGGRLYSGQPRRGCGAVTPRNELPSVGPNNQGAIHERPHRQDRGGMATR